MPQVNVSSDDLNFAKNFLIQYLRDTGFEGSVEEGTALHDLLIKAQSYYYALYKADAKKVSAYLSLSKALEYKDELGEEYDNAVDSILSNWFVTRKEGIPTAGRLRLYFHKPQAYLAFPADTTLATTQRVNLRPLVDTVFSETDFKTVVNTAANRTEYYIELTVVSDVATNQPIRVEDRVSAYISNVFFRRAEIPEAFTPGYTKEDSDTFIARTKKAITTREMITDRAISTVLLDEFSAISHIYIAGYGSAEQLRDIKTFDHVTVHVGNKTDIYVRAGLTRQIRNFQAQFNFHRGWYVELPAELGAVDILKVSVLRNEVETDLPYLVEGSEEHRFAVHRGTDTVLNIQSSIHPTDSDVTVTYLRSDSIYDVDGFLRSSTQRVACYDPLVKGMYPVVLNLDMALHIDLPFGETMDQKLVQIRSVIRDFVTRYPQGKSLVVSEIIGELHCKIPQIRQVELPVTLSYTVRDPATGENTIGTFSDLFTLPSGLSDQVSWNTMMYFIDDSLMSIDVSN